jgi:hypothetical protein
MSESIFLPKKMLSFKTRRLIMDSSELKLYEEGFFTENSISLQTSEIHDLRFGIEVIRGLEFNIGREYLILIKDKNKKVLKISFSSLYGYQRIVRDELYILLINTIWNKFFDSKFEYFLKKFSQNESFQIGNVLFNTDGIEILNQSLLTSNSLKIYWENVQTEDYISNFTLIDICDVINKNRSFDYLKDWNTLMLKAVVRSILSQKGLEHKPLF